MSYKFVIKAHDSSHIPEGISAKKTQFKWLSCEVVTRDICLRVTNRGNTYCVYLPNPCKYCICALFIKLL